MGQRCEFKDLDGSYLRKWKSHVTFLCSCTIMVYIKIFWASATHKAHF